VGEGGGHAHPVQELLELRFCIRFLLCRLWGNVGLRRELRICVKEGLCLHDRQSFQVSNSFVYQELAVMSIQSVCTCVSSVLACCRSWAQPWVVEVDVAIYSYRWSESCDANKMDVGIRAIFRIVWYFRCLQACKASP